MPAHSKQKKHETASPFQAEKSRIWQVFAQGPVAAAICPRLGAAELMRVHAACTETRAAFQWGVDGWAVRRSIAASIVPSPMLFLPTPDGGFAAGPIPCSYRQTESSVTVAFDAERLVVTLEQQQTVAILDGNLYLNRSRRVAVITPRTAHTGSYHLILNGQTAPSIPMEYTDEAWPVSVARALVNRLF